jgi:hypothetical protein
MFVAKPNLNNTLHSKVFATKIEAVQYLEEFTGIEMSYEINKKLRKKLMKDGMSQSASLEAAKVYDWEIIGKLFPENA